MTSTTCEKPFPQSPFIGIVVGRVGSRRFHHGRGFFRDRLAPWLALHLVLELLVAERPKDDARVVTVAAHQALDLAQGLGGVVETAILVDDEQAEAVAGLENSRSGRVVGGAIGIGSPFPSGGGRENPATASGSAAPTPGMSPDDAHAADRRISSR